MKGKSKSTKEKGGFKPVPFKKGDEPLTAKELERKRDAEQIDPDTKYPDFFYSDKIRLSRKDLKEAYRFAKGYKGKRAFIKSGTKEYIKERRGK